MKKTVSWILILALAVLNLAACGSVPAASGPAETMGAGFGTDLPETPSLASEAQHADALTSEDAAAASAEASAEAPTAAGADTLVVYFSLAGEQYNVGVIDEGNTAIVAKLIAAETGADLFSIDPVEPYPEDYDGKLDVARQEQRSNARPAFVGQVENWDSYDTVFLGYPIWWGEIPNIVYTFMDSYDFTGKTVIPFCTHAGSGLSGTEEAVAKATGAELRDGLAVAGTTAQNDRDAAAEAVHGWLTGVYSFR